MRWVKGVEVEVAATVLDGAVGVGQDGWVALRLLGLAATASVPVVDIAKRTLSVCLATRQSAQNAARS